MKNLIIIGAGGYFLEIYEYIASDLVTGQISDLSLKGVLDDGKIKQALPLPFLGKVNDYQIEEDDIFLVAIGNVLHRTAIFETLKERGARFYTYIHSSAIVSPTASIGVGSIICPMSIVNASSVVGNNVSVNVNVSIGHEAEVGDNSVLSPYCALNGRAKVGNGVFVGTRSTIFPGVSVGAQTTVDSHTAVRKSAPQKMLLSERSNFVAQVNRFLG